MIARRHIRDRLEMLEILRLAAHGDKKEVDRITRSWKREI